MHWLIGALCLVAVNIGGTVLAATKIRLPDGRSYSIIVPDDEPNPPLILALHGGGGNGAWMEKVSGLTPKALAAGFAIAYPDGSGRRDLLTWNAGYCCAYAANNRIDDIGFLSRVIEDAVSRYGIDRRNIFVTGMSNGGMMAELFAASQPGKARAVASVAGPFDVRHTPIRRSVPLMHIHGTKDDMVPYQGGRGKFQVTGAAYAPVEELISTWVASFGRGLTTTTETIDPVRDRTKVIKTSYWDGSKPVVLFYKVEGGSHSWPGSARAGRRGITKDIDASDEIIRFFDIHRRGSPLR